MKWLLVLLAVSGCVDPIEEAFHIRSTATCKERADAGDYEFSHCRDETGYFINGARQ